MDLTRLVHCMSEDLCKRIIDEQKDYKRAEVIANDQASSVSDWRTNDLRMLTGDLVPEVHSCLNKAIEKWVAIVKSENPPEVFQCLPLPGTTFNMDSHREDIQVLRYTVGQEYFWHTDAGIDPYKTDNNSRNRCLSVVVYLNDDVVGGETQMPGRKYKPQTGKALIFPSNWCYPHRACPVIEGTKYALVTWYHMDFLPARSD